MNPKIPKLREELRRNRERIAVIQAHNRELEKNLRELENLDIVGMVRAQGLTLEQFTELFQGAASHQITQKKEEESGYEETT